MSDQTIGEANINEAVKPPLNGTSNGAGHGAKKASPEKTSGRLEETLRLIRARDADRRAAMSEGHQSLAIKLEALRAELEDVISDIPEDVDLFDFQVSQGRRPRLWIDAIAFVTMTKDGEAYRFLRESRNGPILICESDDREIVGQAVVAHVAERLENREHALNEEFIQADNLVSDVQSVESEDKTFQVAAVATVAQAQTANQMEERRGRAVRSFLVFLVGMIAGAIGMIAIAWFRTDLGL